MIKYNYKTKKLEGKVKSFDKERWLDINFGFDKSKKPTEKELEHLQVMVYVMVGGGMLGRFAMSQPADFYIDLRVGRLPYPQKDIFNVIEMLKAVCDYLKKDPHRLPEPHFYGCWVF